MRTLNIPLCERKSEAIPIMPPDLALLLSLICSNHPCLEHLFMVPKVFEPLLFGYIEMSLFLVLRVSGECLRF